MADEAWKLSQIGAEDLTPYRQKVREAGFDVELAFVKRIRAAAMLAAAQKQTMITIHSRVPEAVLLTLHERGFRCGYNRDGSCYVRWDVM